MKRKTMIQTGIGRMIKNFSSFLAIAFSLTTIRCSHGLSYSLSIPSTYTAMEGDLPVSFMLAHGPASSFDAASIHLHYLPGDSFLETFRKSDSSILLSSQAVPLGSQGGNIIFPCGSVTHAGPHRAYLTILRNSSLYGRPRRVTVAKSRILYVSWPQMSISVPEKLETYSLNVDIRISFTRNLCSTLLRQEEEGAVRSSNLRFAPRLELLECSKSLVNPYAQDCQLSNEAKIWYREDLPPNFYQRAAMEVSINCSFWGQEGTFRAFLRTDLSHAPIIARSRPIVVEQNPVYSLSSNYKSIYPCLQNDIKPIIVEKPFCASPSDRIQVYGQVYSLTGNNLIVPSQHWKYLGSQLVPESSEESAHISCGVFSKEFLRVCFKYVSYSIIGTSNVTESLCLPIEEIDSSIETPTWSTWSEWSTCSRECRDTPKDPKGFRTRHRYCQFPQGDDTMKLVLCDGSPVERVEDCGEAPCNDEAATQLAPANTGGKRVYEEEESAESPCSCGCIYFVQANSRRLVIRSRRNCFRDHGRRMSLHWKIKTNTNHTLSAVASLEEFECPGAWFNFRQGSSLQDDIINQMKIPKHNNSVNSASNFLTIELTPSPHSDSAMTCDFLLVLEVFKRKPVHRKDSGVVHRPLGGLESGIVSAVHLLSLAGIIFLSIVSVCLSCFICIIFQFEHRRKKYVDWQRSSGSPDEEDHMELLIPETSTEDLPLLPAACWSRSRRGRLGFKNNNGKWAGNLLESLRADREEEKRARMHRRRSLQDLSLFPQDDSPSRERSPAHESLVISPDQITKAIYHAAAIEDKRKRVKLRLKPPNGTPSRIKDPDLDSDKRKSRSVSDIASLISFKLPPLNDDPKTEKTPTPPPKTKPKKDDDALSNASTLVQSMTSTRSSRYVRGSVPRRLRISHRNSDLSSVSSSSFLSSHQSLDMEYDLYDCHLENVSAMPGSNFIAENYWVFEESDLEGFQLTELFPREEEEDSRTLTREDAAMMESQTSDLTASMVSSTNTIRPRSSSSFRIRGKMEDSMNISGYHSGEENEECGLLPPTKKDLMSITHIDEREEDDKISATCL